MPILVTLVSLDVTTRQIEEGKPFTFYAGERIAEDSEGRAEF